MNSLSFFTHEFGNHEIRVVGDGRFSVFDVLVAFGDCNAKDVRMVLKRLMDGHSEVVSSATTLGDTPSGRATIYRIENIPEGVGQTKVLQLLRHTALPWTRFQVNWSEIDREFPCGANLVFSDKPAQPSQIFNKL